MRITLIVVLLLLIAGGIYYFVSNPPAPREPTPQYFTVGVVKNPPALNSAWEGFRKRMEDFGYQEGKNITYKITEVGKDLTETKQKIELLLASHPHLIYTMGVLATRSAKELLEEKRLSIPIVFGVVSDPVGGKLVQSIKSSGNNLTGVSATNEIVTPKRLALFMEMVPSIKRVIFAWNDPNTSGVDKVRTSAKELHVELIDKQVASTIELTSYISSFPFKKGDGILRAGDSVNAGGVSTIIKTSLDKKVPLSGTNRSDVEKGALMSYGANYEKIGEQAARLVDAVLKGARPSDLPIEVPAEIELVVNKKTASDLGITIPESFLVKVNRFVNQ